MADNIKISMRLALYPVMGQTDGISMQLISRLIGNRTWRLLISPGDLREPRNQSQLARFAKTNSTSSLIYTVYIKTWS